MLVLFLNQNDAAGSFRQMSPPGFNVVVFTAVADPTNARLTYCTICYYTYRAGRAVPGWTDSVISNPRYLFHMENSQPGARVCRPAHPPR